MKYADRVLTELQERYKSEPEFLQAAEGVLASIGDYVEDHSDIEKYGILDRLVEPDRILTFRVTWIDGAGKAQTNRGYRVQFSNAIGPYKGGLRFHPTVNQSILKFLGFEQIFKNSLTGLWLGGAKGGSDFDPKGKSDAEVMSFCESFMTELFNYIGPDTDVPAGDIGVGEREIGYLYGWYKKLANQFHGSLTGKGADWGGSSLRPQATGYGLIYFVEAMLQEMNQKLEGKKIIISGSGNVSQYAAEKAVEQGAKVITLSDSDGYILDSEGLNEEKLQFVKELKNIRRGRISEYANKYKSAKFFKDQKPWSEEADIYLPCATQNEIDGDQAKKIAGSRPILVAEGANMPTTPQAVRVFKQAEILHAPDKASNAGGVAVSGLEMSQNMANLAWEKEDVDKRLHKIMNEIHDKCVKYGQAGGNIDYIKGADIAGFARVADAMLSQGVW
ncbi:MAG TPA: NADP-specific glutamate dehydrogenase [Candidatus Saccharimonadales bacterium]|nr:NADP-specific glutamate dehydrogenase [Candidatus Saccharimonadales bacterium]